MVRTYFVLMIMFILASLFVGDNGDKIIFFDVGVGDSTLVLYDDLVVLIDGGPADNLLYKLDGYFDGINPKIDILIMTHLHTDHYSGFRELLKRYEIGEIWLPDYCERVLLPKYLLSAPVKYVLGSGSFSIGDLKFDWITPTYQSNCIPISDSKSVNNSSIIIKLSTTKRKILLMGDAESNSESELLRSYGGFLESEVLKAGHHCSDTSSSMAFLQAVSPDIAICSTGKDNSYGHPSNVVLERFEELGVAYLVTYETGDIEFEL